MTQWWVNLDFACGLVVTDEKGIIVDAMPILRKFIGQNINNLEKWNGHFIERKELVQQ